MSSVVTVPLLSAIFLALMHERGIINAPSAYAKKAKWSPKALVKLLTPKKC